MAVIFLGLIFLPSGVLGYLSWNAIQAEKQLAEQKIVKSYRNFVLLAAREIDNELRSVQAGLQSSVEKALERLGPQPASQQLDSLVSAEPLVSSCALLLAPGEVVYPPEPGLQRKGLADHVERSETIAREYDLFNELADRGEELEYRGNNLDGATTIYRRVLRETSSPQLHAMAYSLIGRAQTKKADWRGALRTYEKLLHNYPEERDLHRMYLRFLAQYQIAVCLRSLKREREAVEALLRLYEDLLERSDTINLQQYTHFKDWIMNLMPTPLSAPNLSELDSYQAQFQKLAKQPKKPLSDKYFVQVFDDKLRELVIERKPYRPIIRYSSGQTDDEPFLLGFRSLPDQSGFQVSGILGIRVNLTQLRERIFPAILRRLKASDEVTLAILDNTGSYVIGTTQPEAAPVAMHALDSPFEFWQVGVYIDDDESPNPLTHHSAILLLWLIPLLLFSIFFGVYIFIRHARQAARISEMKSTFVSRVSHELRTPVTSIKMLAENLDMQLRRRPLIPEKDFRTRTEQYLSVIRRESDRLGRLIENILDFSRIERGVKQYTFEYEMPAAVLQKAIDSFRPQAEAQGFTLTTKIDDSLPEMLLDADGITQAVLNLLGNAVRYSENEKIVEVRAFRQRNHVCVEIEDHGVGIATAQISMIFDEFYRVDQKLNSSRQEGMGLGLTLVQHIVQAHGGTIKVRSVEGKGSTFIMRLPLPTEENVSATVAKEKSNQQDEQLATVVGVERLINTPE